MHWMPTHNPAETRASPWRAGMRLRRRIRPNAFGNALGSSLAEANWGGGQQDLQLSNAVYGGANTTPAPYGGTGLQFGRATGLKVSPGALAQWDAGVNDAIADAASKTDVYLTDEQEARLQSGQTVSDVYSNDVDGPSADARLALRRSVMGLQGPNSSAFNGERLGRMTEQAMDAPGDVHTAASSGNGLRVGGSGLGLHYVASMDSSQASMMRKVGGFLGDLFIGGVKGLDNLIPETLAFGYRMTGYAAAGLTSLLNTDVSDRMFAQYERVTGRVFDYDNGVQAFGGLAAQLAAPTIFKGFSAGGSALYEFEQSGKFAINDKYRHWLPGSSSMLEAETTFYAYKNSKYLQTEYKPLQLWMTPDLMTSREAVQKLATPFATGYDNLLTVTLPAGAKIVSPRPVWSMFGRPGGGTELRAYTSITQDMWKLSVPPR